jgi:toxin ParE1/3/4
MNLRYTSRAKNDVDLAFEWYELQRRGLGFEFLDCVEASINNIIYFPAINEK